MRARRPLAVLAAGLLVVAACGTDDEATDSTEAPAATDAPAATEQTETPAEPTDDAEDGETAPDDGDAASEAGSDDGSTDDASLPPDTDDDADGSTEEPTEEPTDGDAADEVDAMAWPDDGCSTDGSPTPVAAAEGPAPLIELRPESADSPFPDVSVRRINCKGGWENLRNEVPGEQTLLVWFWAPH